MIEYTSIVIVNGRLNYGGKGGAGVRKAIYAGSFDPITNGHVDILLRSSRMFDQIIVAVVHNVHKRSLFSLEERVEQVCASLSGLDNVEVICLEGLVTDYMRENGIQTIIRGLRSITDFEYEAQITFFNQRLLPEADTIFMMSDPQYTFVSSTGVKEAALFGGDVSSLVPSVVANGLSEKSEKLRAAGELPGFK